MHFIVMVLVLVSALVFYVLKKIGEILTRNDFNAGISMVKLRQQKSTARVCLWHKKRVSFIGQESGVS